MSERLELSQLAKAEARRHRESLLQLFSGQPSCAIGAACDGTRHRGR